MQYSVFSIKKFGIFLFILYTLYFILNTPVYGQQVGLSISPPLLEVVIKPGKSILIAYSLENFADPSVLSAKVVSFKPKDNQGNIELQDELEGPVRFSLDNANLTFDQPFFLKTKDRQQLLLRIRVPDGAPEGDYYYTLLAEAQPSPTFEGATSSRAKARIGSNILITVSQTGRTEIKGKVAFFDVIPRYKFNLLGNTYRFFDSGDKIPVILIVANSGKNVIKPDGEVVLRGNFGEKISSKILQQNILAESQRQLIATPSAEIDCEIDKPPIYCRRPVSLLFSGFFLGNYELSTTISFGEGSPNVYASTSFTALPFKFGLGFIIVIIVITIILKRLKR